MDLFEIDPNSKTLHFVFLSNGHYNAPYITGLFSELNGDDT